MAYNGLLVTDRFSIDGRQMLSEDRGKLHVAVSYRVDSELAHQIEQMSKVNIGYGGNLRKARRLEGQIDNTALLYQRTGQNLWQFTRIQTGFR